MQFSVNKWAAWAPGFQLASQWRDWHQQAGSVLPAPGKEPAEGPDVSWVPAAQRRRLSLLTRMQLACAKEVIGDDSLPVVFACRHGELHRTFQLLTSLGQSEPLSPTHFSLSVHNAAAGLFGILRADQAPANVVVGDDDSLILGLVEAYATLAEGADEVLLVAGEQSVPAPYGSYMDGEQVDHALAVRLVRGSDITVARSDNRSAQTGYLPLAMQMAGLLASNSSGTLQCNGKEWQWQR
ncbi:beta-ketoacyl synthase chain length factor [Gallaecimonas sp. GXIMD1310]|uniref:beta-ketoacyl synthase chain length factor n=1 Tax=Gallaecimonas sp. GXIMD1310 TaxID=3131926 RepID=UPI0032556691